MGRGRSGAHALGKCDTEHRALRWCFTVAVAHALTNAEAAAENTSGLLEGSASRAFHKRQYADTEAHATLPHTKDVTTDEESDAGSSEDDKAASEDRRRGIRCGGIANASDGNRPCLAAQQADVRSRVGVALLELVRALDGDRGLGLRGTHPDSCVEGGVEVWDV